MINRSLGHNKILVTGLIACLAVLLGAILWLLLGPSAGSEWSRIRREGVIRIGYAVEAPYAFVSTAGKVTGKSPETARRIASRLGIRRIEWRQTEFGSLITELNARRFDVIAAGLFITRDRAQKVSFSEPTVHVLQGMLVQRGNPRRLHSYEAAIKIPSIKIAVLRGSVEAVLLQRMGVPESRLLPVPDALAGRVAVESGLASALALSAPTIQWFARHRNLGKTEAAESFIQPKGGTTALAGYVGFAFRHSDHDLLQAWNGQLAAFIGSAEHLQLIESFGFTKDALPGPVTTAQILTSPESP